MGQSPTKEQQDNILNEIYHIDDIREVYIKIRGHIENKHTTEDSIRSIYIEQKANESLQATKRTADILYSVDIR